MDVKQQVFFPRLSKVRLSTFLSPYLVVAVASSLFFQFLDLKIFQFMGLPYSHNLFIVVFGSLTR